MSLEQLLLAQARVARLGGKDQMNWWETTAHSTAGKIVLNRLFPRTAAWAAIELSIEVARVTHNRDLPPIPTVTLFEMGKEINRALSDLLLQQKTGGTPTESYMESLSFAADLATAAQQEYVNRTASKVVGQRVVCVGDLPSGVDRTDSDVWGILAAGYQFSGTGQLIVPYLRVV